MRTFTFTNETNNKLYFYTKLREFIYTNGRIDGEIYGTFAIKNDTIDFYDNKITNHKFTFHTHPKLNRNCYFSFPSDIDLHTIFFSKHVKIHVILHREIIYVVHLFDKTTLFDKEKYIASIETLMTKTDWLKRHNNPSSYLDEKYIMVFNNSMQDFAKIHAIETYTSHNKLFKLLKRLNH